MDFISKCLLTVLKDYKWVDSLTQNLGDYTKLRLTMIAQYTSSSQIWMMKTGQSFSVKRQKR